ncbi:hypothetical protein QDR33_17600 [Acinetobacter baumannii]|uniref:hypothetical protein n=1 Tax=Acinetobacter baumannii TaxID=470 RepID=UPI00244BBA8E|nr:hypothetical protein [Acinetobacter baumannii]MDH2493360.1 hypothetical protein [Acinetobacter baumannii]
MKQEDYLLACFLFCIGLVIYLAKSLTSDNQDKWHVIVAKAVLNRLHFIICRGYFDMV